MSGRNVPNYRILIERFNSSRQWERTLETAREWLSVEPENSEAHMAAGQALVYLDRHSEAERHIAIVLATQPDNDIAHRHILNLQFPDTVGRSEHVVIWRILRSERSRERRGCRIDRRDC